ncbi:MAG: hypothetical protein GTN62_14280 [Gemmatimonadales bacterium]|nr:hypothetical protein [Gemmatimonadales bacterium]NIN13239.1 hypothetical protein [Gemmatimonadales bacterium]NIN51256.1 hypothetical protein [Gemmatimonadales bacterium]NIP08720.1 hypothetical protein [Gemmatimonadales bacterium]NIR00973.1 hypothetical protein [Gemmatimonadales bacterium]
MDTGNVVVFGPVTLEGRPSTNGGTQTTFSVPKVRPATGELPPMVLPPGEYQVIVRSARGSSKPASFTLTRPGNPGVRR